MSDFDYDVLVIGAGPGGYVAAIRAAQLGLKTACAESRETLGGTCLNVGCIPSKAMLHASELYDEAANGTLAKLGVKIDKMSLDLPTLQGQRVDAVKGLTGGIEFLFKKNKVTWLKGLASFTGANTVEINGEKVTAKNIVIATGSSVTPLPGVDPQILDAEGVVLTGAASGNLVIAKSWPGQMRTVWGDHDRFFQTYFTTYKGKFFTGDGARRDEDGYYWITGRVDDVINVSGHRMGTAEVESALVAHPKVAEAAVVGMPHEVKGQGIYAYVTLNSGEAPGEELRAELRNWVRQEIGPIATPDAIQFAPGLPKTRSGKIMRRILRKIAEGEIGSLGDTSTLADPAVVEDLVANRVG